MKIFTRARDGQLYFANGIYVNGHDTVLKGSKVNLIGGGKYSPSKEIVELRNDTSLYDENGILQRNVDFDSLSSAATFVTGRIANGMIVWKTDNGKNVRYTLNKGVTKNGD